jgi:aminoglycoside 3-N-acetyltransferase
VTAAALLRELDGLGLMGESVLVHASLRRLGLKDGGALVQALLETLGPQGTLLVPTHTNGLSEPSLWRHPPAPPDLWPHLRETLPPFDPARTPSAYVGALPEIVRQWPGARRSAHPHFSFAGLGARAEALLAPHPLEYALGPEGVLGRLEAADGQVLLLGVDHSVNTTLHLAEHRLVRPPARRRTAAPVLDAAGQRQWVTFDELDVDSDDFAALGEAFALETGLERRVALGAAQARCVPVRPLLAFAAAWLAAHRPAPVSPAAPGAR